MHLRSLEARWDTLTAGWHRYRKSFENHLICTEQVPWKPKIWADTAAATPLTFCFPLIHMCSLSAGPVGKRLQTWPLIWWIVVFFISLTIPIRLQSFCGKTQKTGSILEAMEACHCCLLLQFFMARYVILSKWFQRLCCTCFNRSTGISLKC